MNNLEINGDSVGYYTFDKGYTNEDKKKRIPFQLAIKRGINQFVGQVFEEVEFGGIEDEILIKGHQTVTRSNLQNTIPSSTLWMRTTTLFQ